MTSSYWFYSEEKRALLLQYSCKKPEEAAKAARALGAKAA